MTIFYLIYFPKNVKINIIAIINKGNQNNLIVNIANALKTPNKKTILMPPFKLYS